MTYRTTTPTTTTTTTTTRRWTAVCDLARLTTDRGAAALIDGHAVAVFSLWTGEVVAIDNIDPCSGASVLSRGVVGDVEGRPTVASPMYKDRFDLRTGCCLDKDEYSVAVHRVVVSDGVVLVQLEGPE
jgi:nitrite reductase (NADH) small subunit